MIVMQASIFQSIVHAITKHALSSIHVFDQDLHTLGYITKHSFQVSCWLQRSSVSCSKYRKRMHFCHCFSNRPLSPDDGILSLCCHQPINYSSKLVNVYVHIHQPWFCCSYSHAQNFFCQYIGLLIRRN